MNRPPLFTSLVRVSGIGVALAFIGFGFVSERAIAFVFYASLAAMLALVVVDAILGSEE